MKDKQYIHLARGDPPRAGAPPPRAGAPPNLTGGNDDIDDQLT